MMGCFLNILKKGLDTIKLGKPATADNLNNRRWLPELCRRTRLDACVRMTLCTR